jgi:hypothetical protein
MGTSCRLSTRRLAVTRISSRTGLPDDGGDPALPGCAGRGRERVASDARATLRLRLFTTISFSLAVIIINSRAAPRPVSGWTGCHAALAMSGPGMVDARGIGAVFSQGECTLNPLRL